VSKVGGCLNCGKRYLELQEHGTGLSYGCATTLNMPWTQLTIRPARHTDAVLAITSDKDQCRARCRLRISTDVRYVNAIAEKAVDGSVSEYIPADSRNERDGTTGSRCGNGLIRPLAAGGHLKLSPQHRLPRSR
jgi:hypothetical protein